VTAPAAIGGPFQLTNQVGQAVTDASLKGKPTLISSASPLPGRLPDLAVRDFREY